MSYHLRQKRKRLHLETSHLWTDTVWCRDLAFYSWIKLSTFWPIVMTVNIYNSLQALNINPTGLVCITRKAHNLLVVHFSGTKLKHLNRMFITILGEMLTIWRWKIKLWSDTQVTEVGNRQTTDLLFSVIQRCAVRCLSGTSADCQQTTQRYISERRTLHNNWTDEKPQTIHTGRLLSRGLSFYESVYLVRVYLHLLQICTK
jgi:hypothetical protein